MLDDRFVPSRRGFLALSSLAGAGLVFNVGWLNAAWADDAPGPGFTAALKRMRTHGRPGLAIVVPQDAAQRAALAEQLSAVFPPTNLHAGLPEGATALLEAVWLCARPEDVNAQPGETLVLLSPEGKRVAGAPPGFSDPAAVRAAAEKLLGPGRAARAQKESAPAEVQEALKLALGSTTFWDGARLLQERFDDVASAVIHTLQGAGDEAQGNLSRVLNRIYWDRLTAPSGEFPYGATVKVDVAEPDPCPPCGMAMPSIRARTFLGFFSGK